MAEKILIADDEEMVRSVLVKFVTMLGFECLQAKNGEEIIELLRKEKPIRLFLLDINMPKIDGITALKEIRNYYPYSYIIMMTGDCKNYSLDTIIQSGGNDLIYKPLELNKLKQKIEYILTKAD